jgi:hypothetical protein
MIHELCCFDGVEGLECHFLLMALMRDKNLIHIINGGQISLTYH